MGTLLGTAKAHMYAWPSIYIYASSRRCIRIHMAPFFIQICCTNVTFLWNWPSSMNSKVTLKFVLSYCIGNLPGHEQSGRIYCHCANRAPEYCHPHCRVVMGRRMSSIDTNIHDSGISIASDSSAIRLRSSLHSPMLESTPIPG